MQSNAVDYGSLESFIKTHNQSVDVDGVIGEWERETLKFVSACNEQLVLAAHQIISN